MVKVIAVYMKKIEKTISHMRLSTSVGVRGDGGVMLTWYHEHHRCYCDKKIQGDEDYHQNSPPFDIICWRSNIKKFC